MFKQSDPNLHEYIQTDGCLFMAELSIAEVVTGNTYTHEEINLLYSYVTPDYMRDGGEARTNRCYIEDHEQIIRAGLIMLGDRRTRAQYLYRHDLDTDKYIIGSKKSRYRCNFFFTKVRCADKNGDEYTHFYRSTKTGTVVYNAGNCASKDILSIRGFQIS